MGDYITYVVWEKFAETPLMVTCSGVAPFPSDRRFEQSFARFTSMLFGHLDCDNVPRSNT